MTATAPTAPAPELGLPEVEQKKPEPGDQVLWSVTTVIGVLEKPALLYWAAEQTAKKALKLRTSLDARIEQEGELAVVKQLRDARFDKRDLKRDGLTDAAFGTHVHGLCESYALSGVKPAIDVQVFGIDAPLAQACLDRFDEWLHEFQPEYVATEVMVATPTYGIAGTCDTFLNIGGVRFVGDYKSSKKSVDAQGKQTGLYPEIALQLAAYRHAELAAVWRPRRYEQFRRRYYLIGAAELAQAVAVPEVDYGLGIKITPEHCTAYPIKCDAEIYGYFLNCLEVARYQFEASKQVIGSPLVTTGDAA